MSLNIITNHYAEIQAARKERRITWEDHENNREVTIFWSVVFMLGGAVSGYNTAQTLGCNIIRECGGAAIGAVYGCALGLLMGCVDKIPQ